MSQEKPKTKEEESIRYSSLLQGIGEMGGRIKAIRSEIHENVLRKLKAIDEQMSDVLQWLKKIRMLRLTPEQEENLRRVADFRLHALRKRLDSIFRIKDGQSDGKSGED